MNYRKIFKNFKDIIDLDEHFMERLERVVV